QRPRRPLFPYTTLFRSIGPISRYSVGLECLYCFRIYISHPTSDTMLKEFKEFALKGNMVDMAVGIIIGAAFATVVQSLVNDIIMPVIAALVSVPDFSNLSVTLRNPTGPV